MLRFSVKIVTVTVFYLFRAIKYINKNTTMMQDGRMHCTSN